jgi:DNA-binding NarL/FixJ family response regulator
LSVASYFFSCDDITEKGQFYKNVTHTSRTGVHMSSHRSRILIADDHNLVAELCKRLLEPEFQVVGTVSNGRDLVRAAAKLKPDVIVVDIAMPLLNGLDAGKQVKEALHTVKLVYLTMNTDPELALEAFDRGASGYLLKTCAASEMVLAVREVLRGKTYLSPTLKEKVAYLRWEHKKMLEEADRLAERQREVLQLLAEGKVMKEIGDTLNMTTRTVAFHKYRIMEVLGATSNAELVRYAVRNNIVAA